MPVIPLLLPHGFIKNNFEEDVPVKMCPKGMQNVSTIVLMTVYAHDTAALTLIMFMLQII